MRRFRAWHTKLNHYLKDDEFYVDSDGSVYSSFATYDDEIIETDYIENFSRDDFGNGYVIREDDTGLEDKNGKEIYEGDIVAYDYGFGTYVVTYRRYDASFVLEDDNREEIINLVLAGHPFYEVVGNIHENPELLEGKK